MKKRILRFFFFFLLTLSLLGLLGTFGFYYAVKGGLFGKLPSDTELREIRNFRSSDLYSHDGELLGRYFVENRTHVDLKNISPHLINALISTEDVRFYEHRGVDQTSLMRVLFKSIILGKNTGGGSTISQQLIKNLYGRKRNGLLTMPVNKVKEAILANKLNELYTKDEILELYFNTVSFGEDTYGIGTACERFFNVSSAKTTVEQSAVLIGMLKAPTSYNPRLNPDKSLRRRNTVLNLMYQHEHLPKEDYDRLIKLPIKLNYSRSYTKTEHAGYFKEYIKEELKQILNSTDKGDGKPYNIEQDGLKIYTSIESKIQFSAEESIKNHMRFLTRKLRSELKKSLSTGSKKSIVWEEIRKTNRFKSLKNKERQKAEAELKKRVNTKIFTFNGTVDTLISPLDSVIHHLCVMQSAYLACNPKDGRILAYVGGGDFKYFPFDRAFAQRQVGSIFKPIIYSKALQNGVKPCDYFKNQQISYSQYENWTPKNSDGNYGGKYSVMGALTNSVNTVSVQLLMKQGINETIEYAHELGIEDSLPHSPALSLGAASLSPYSMLGVYSTFANSGNKTPFYCIEKIETSSGDIIYQHEKEKGTKVLDEGICTDLSNMLQSVVNNGTGKRLRGRYKLTENIAGKTGTTQNQTDGWFVGYNPNFVGIVWTGADNPSIRFSSIKDGQGANMALPVWANVFKTISRDKSLRSKFYRPFKEPETYDCEYFIPEKEGFIHDLFKRKKPRKNDSDGLEKQENKKGLLNKLRKKK